MGWSTRELAHVAGTTLRTVRHYHEIGLLAEPERLPNGYKSYRTEHLVRLLQIRRLTRLGIPLSTIAAMDGDASNQSECLDETLATVDAELAATIANLTQARLEIAQLRRHPTPTDLPFDVSAAAAEAQLSPTDRSLFAVIAHVAGDEGAEHLHALLQDYRPDDATAAFDALPADADDDTREALARRMTPQTTTLIREHPRPADGQTDRTPASRRAAAADALIETMLDLYNPAQLDVLVRVWRATGLI